jgi:AraC-like DNA-binding protein
MQSDVPTYQIKLLQGRAKAAWSGSDVALRGFGLVPESPNGYLRIERMTLGLEEAVISRVSATGYSGRLREDAFFTFVLQGAGRYDVQISGRDYGMSPGSLMAFRPNERKTLVRVGNAGTRNATTLQLPIARMRHLAQAMGTSVDKVISQDGMSLHGESGQTLANVLPQLADDLFQRPGAPLPPRLTKEISHLIEEVLCELIGRRVEQTSSRRIFPAFHRVRQAEEMMHAQSDEPMSILEIAQTLGVSLRSLQLAFREVHGGMSPRAFLNRLRLERARHLLQTAEDHSQVTTIAMDCGFYHLGRFAQAYARAFGERPRDTLGRRRA